MGKAPPPPEVDIAALLESVHGRTDESRREEQVDRALRAIETTHRKASMAVRNFEHHGRLEAEAHVLAALGALADDSDAPPPPVAGSHERRSAEDAQGTGAEATQVTGAAPTQVTAAASNVAPDAEATRIAAPAAAGTSAAATARAASAAPKTPAILSDEATAPGTLAGRDWAASDEPTAAPPPSVSPVEVTQTFAISGPPMAPPQQRAAPGGEAKLKPSSVYSGRGADMPNKEPTQTKLIKRPKK